MEATIVLLAVAAADLASLRFGTRSNDGHDWTLPPASRE